MNRTLSELIKRILLNIFGFSLAIFISILMLFGIINLAENKGREFIKNYIELEEDCKISTDRENFLILKCSYINIKNKETFGSLQNIDFKGKNLLLRLTTRLTLDLNIKNFNLSLNIKPSEEKKEGFETFKSKFVQKVIDRINLDIGKGDIDIAIGKDKIKIKNLNLVLKNRNLSVDRKISVIYDKWNIDINNLKGHFENNSLVLTTASVKVPNIEEKNLKIYITKPFVINGKYDFTTGKIFLASQNRDINILFNEENKNADIQIFKISTKSYIEDNTIDTFIKADTQAKLNFDKNKISLDKTKLIIQFGKHNSTTSYLFKTSIGRTDIELGDKKLFFENIFANLTGSLNGKNSFILNIPISNIKNFVSLKGSFLLKNNNLKNLEFNMSLYGLGKDVLKINLENQVVNGRLSRIDINKTLSFLKRLSEAEELKDFEIKNIYELVKQNKEYMSNFYIAGDLKADLNTQNLNGKLEIGDISNQYLRDYLSINKLKLISSIAGKIDDKLNITLLLLADNRNFLTLSGFINKLDYLDLKLKAYRPINIKPDKDIFITAKLKDGYIKGKLDDLKVDLNANLDKVRYKEDIFNLNIDINSKYSIKEGIALLNLKSEGLQGDLSFNQKENLAKFTLFLTNYNLSKFKIKELPEYVKLKNLSLKLLGKINLEKETKYKIEIKNGEINLALNKQNEKGEKEFKINNIKFSFNGSLDNENRNFNLYTKNKNLKIELADKSLILERFDLVASLTNDNFRGNYKVFNLKDEKNNPLFTNFKFDGSLDFNIGNNNLVLNLSGILEEKDIYVKYDLNANGNINQSVGGKVSVRTSSYSKYIDENQLNFYISKEDDKYKAELFIPKLKIHFKDYKIYSQEIELSTFFSNPILADIDIKEFVIKDKYNVDVLKFPKITLKFENNNIFATEKIKFYGLLNGTIEKLKYDLNNKNLDIDFNGILNSDLLSQLIVFGIVKGKVELTAKYSGNINDFPKGIYMKIVADRFKFKNRFLRDILIADKLELILKNGILSANIIAKSNTNKKLNLKILGTTEFRKILENKPAKNRFDIYGENIAVRYKSIFRGNVETTNIKVLINKEKTEENNVSKLEQIKSLNVDIVGDINFSGRVHVNREFLNEFFKEEETKEKENPIVKELKKHIKLSIHIKTTNPLLIYGNFGDAYMNVSIAVNGTLAEPEVDGQITFVYGKINIFGIKYNMDYFNVVISKNVPFINARLTTMIRDTIIRITIYSTYNQPQVLISSIPPKPQRELMAMLFFKDVSSAVGSLTTGMLPLFKDVGALLKAILPAEGSREETEGILNTGIEVSILPEYSPTEGLIPFVMVKRPLTKRFYIAVSKALLQNENLAETGWWEVGAKLTERSLFRYRKFDSGIIDYGFTITTQFDF